MTVPIFVVSLALVVCFARGIVSLSCGDPGSLLNGSRAITNFYSGGIVKYECDECFRLRGANIIQCTAWGHWTASPPTCDLRTCPPIQIKNGLLLKSRPVGYVYTFVCHMPLVVKGFETTECLCDGKWSHLPPKCVDPPTKLPTTAIPSTASITILKKEFCPKPETKLHNGFIFFIRSNTEKQRPGDRVYYVCKRKYGMVGPNVRVCQPNYKWSGYHPACMVTRCANLSPPVNGRLVGGIKLDDEMEFFCDPGFRLEGVQRIRCNRNGRWSQRPPKCVSACKGFACRIGRICKYDPVLMKPYCNCATNLDCPPVYKPICGSDAQTHNNECIMKATKCRSNSTISKVADGHCVPDGICRINPISRCKGKITAFSYDRSMTTCKSMIVGGCHSSGWNGFATLEECNTNCQDMCMKPVDRGPCSRPRLRWAYIEDLDDCRRFVYGGCLGNSNNFESYKQCKEYCGNNQM